MHPTSGRWYYDTTYNNKAQGYTLVRVPPHWYALQWTSLMEDLPWHAHATTGMLILSGELGSVEIVDQQGVRMRDRSNPYGINPRSLVLPFPGASMLSAGNGTGSDASVSGAAAAAAAGKEPRAYAIWRHTRSNPKPIAVIGQTSKAYRAGFKTRDGAQPATTVPGVVGECWSDAWGHGGCQRQQQSTG